MQQSFSNITVLKNENPVFKTEYWYTTFVLPIFGYAYLKLHLESSHGYALWSKKETEVWSATIPFNWIEFRLCLKTESGFKSLLGRSANINSRKVFDKESLLK